MPASRDADDPIVVVIDDDAHVREALQGLFRSVGLGVEVFHSARAYQEAIHRKRPGCLVLDVRLPGLSGLEFQGELKRFGACPPIVFISGHADVEMCARAMKAGAVDFLSKPVRDQDLLDAVQAALSRDAQLRRDDRERNRGHANLALLTPREHDVMVHVVAGRRNKQIAADLGVSEGTVKLHRSQVMRKLNVGSLAELVRKSGMLNEKDSV